LRVDFRKNTDNTLEQWIYNPSLRISYRHRKKYQVEFELSDEWSNRELVGDNEEQSQGLMATIGYRMEL